MHQDHLTSHLRVQQDYRKGKLKAPWAHRCPERPNWSPLTSTFYAQLITARQVRTISTSAILAPRMAPPMS
jgi:hypothetical protein